MLEKVITILWTIWNHRNNVKFYNHKCTFEVIEQARSTYPYTLYCNKSTNVVNQDDNEGKRSQDNCKRNNVKH